MADVLVAGAAGGREQMIAQAMRASSEVDRVEVHVDINEGLDAFRGQKEKPFVIFGPEAALVEGAADDLRELGYVVLGASKRAAHFEASKAATVKLAREVGAEHPPTFIAEGPDYEGLARRYAAARRPDAMVYKEDGLHGGKGAHLPENQAQANKVLEEIIGRLKDAPPEERIINFPSRRKGKELSAIALVGAGSEDRIELVLAQDFKRIGENDEGLNTGGMGAYAPLPKSLVNDRQREKISDMFDKLLPGMERRGANLQGAVVYLGLMLDEALDGDPTLLEINMRFGDPETQPMFTLMMNNGIDMYRLLRSAAEGEIEHPDVDMRALKGAALTVCLASEGYGTEGSVIVGKEVYGLGHDYDDVTIQLAGVRSSEPGKYVTSGGRVLYVTGSGETVDDAAKAAYSVIDVDGTGAGIGFEGMQFRRDIGYPVRKEWQR